ncbi:MAG: cytochrome c-type biosis protein [Pseudomonadota bacterium]|nr:cytochrome c-type biosis protein [Pseudomonadota bacterium]
MSLEAASIPLAGFAGVLSILSPCVGPTLGAAIALASLGQHLGLAFVIMFAFGMGTSAVLLVAGLLSQQLLMRWRPATLSRAGAAKKLLGWTLLLLAVLVLTGGDKVLETLALGMLPDWAITL